MWPWAHLAVGYLVYTVAVHLYARRVPDGHATVALVFGTQFPDLVDKPLAWTFNVIPNGRSLAHSLITAVVVIVILEIVLQRRNYEGVATAFSIGYLSHLAGDALYPALSGSLYRLGFLAWPVVPAIEYPTEQSFMAHLQELSLYSFVTIETTFGVVVFLIWLADGTPGLGTVTAIPEWIERKLV